MSETTTFRPAKSPGWVIWAALCFNRLDLAWHNRTASRTARPRRCCGDLPRGAGVILTSNHADETDMRACLELSRRCGRRFLYMMNREAFDEGFGSAGWWLQRLGAFSVERGGRERTRRNATPSTR